MAKHNHGLDEQQLRDKGFVKRADGSWWPRGSSPQGGNSETPSVKLERDPFSASTGKTRAEAAREKEDEDCPRFQLVVVSYRPRLIDSSNGCLKWIEDGIVEAGLMPDDSPQYCGSPILFQIKVPGKEQRTEFYLFKLS